MPTAAPVRANLPGRWARFSGSHDGQSTNLPSATQRLGRGWPRAACMCCASNAAMNRVVWRRALRAAVAVAWSGRFNLGVDRRTQAALEL